MQLAVEQPELGGIWEPKAAVLGKLIRARLTRLPRRMLVVGCGSGREAATLAQVLGAEVVGIDLRDAFHPSARRYAELLVGDATRLEFDDRSYDFVYSYHALEHIPDYRQALREMRRVLAPDGAYCIGTPNRARLLGYLGADVGVATKLRWNLEDWRARWRGEFRNEYGAHAGFTAAELRAELLQIFASAEDVSASYYVALYRRYAPLVKALCRLRFASLIFPSVYFVGLACG